MKPRDYCCCAIPIVDAGIYATLAEQLALGIVVGVLALGTPSIVGAATPAAAPWILAITCFVASGIQVLGFLGVAKENSITFRRYLTLHILVTTAVFSIALVWIIMSATGHSTAQSRCETKFFPSANNTAISSEGQILCNIFPWVGVGVMGALWVFLACVQFYFYLILSSYGGRQRRDHANYGSDYNPAHPLTGDIPMVDRPRSWDAGTDKTHNAPRGYGHVRQESTASASSEIDSRYHQKAGSFGNTGYYDPQPYVPGGRQLTHLDQPIGAHTIDPGPTPRFSANYYTGEHATAEGVDRPLPSQPHPAEGSFHRKTPRITAQPDGF